MSLIIDFAFALIIILQTIFGIFLSYIWRILNELTLTIIELPNKIPNKHYKPLKTTSDLMLNRELPNNHTSRIRTSSLKTKLDDDEYIPMNPGHTGLEIPLQHKQLIKSKRINFQNLENLSTPVNKVAQNSFKSVALQTVTEPELKPKPTFKPRPTKDNVAFIVIFCILIHLVGLQSDAMAIPPNQIKTGEVVLKHEKSKFATNVNMSILEIIKTCAPSLIDITIGRRVTFTSYAFNGDSLLRPYTTTNDTYHHSQLTIKELNDDSHCHIPCDEDYTWSTEANDECNPQKFIYDTVVDTPKSYDTRPVAMKSFYHTCKRSTMCIIKQLKTSVYFDRKQPIVFIPHSIKEESQDFTLNNFRLNKVFSMGFDDIYIPYYETNEQVTNLQCITINRS